VSLDSFVIEDSDRVADKANVAATFSFTTSAGGALAIGSFITLTYPPGFFSSSATPSVLMSGSVSGTSAPPSSTAIIVTTATAGIAASANVIVTLSGLKLGLSSTNGLNVSGFLTTSVDPIQSVLNLGAIYGPLKSASVLFSQYLKNSPTTMIFEFRGFSAQAVTSFVLGNLHGFTTAGAGLSGVNCVMNPQFPVFVSNAALDINSSSLTITIAASSIGSNAAVRCSVGGLRTPAAAAAARSDFSISTLTSSGLKVDAIFGMGFPAIFDRFATPLPNSNPIIIVSANDPHLIRSTAVTSFLVSFTSSGAGSIKTITVQGLSDFAFSSSFSSAQACSHDNIFYPAMSVYSSPLLTISVNTSGFSTSSSDVICTLRGLILPSAPVAAKDDLVISTFDVNGAALETMAAVSIPGIFSSVATSVSLSLTSAISNNDNVGMTFAFISPTPISGSKGPIKVISLSGVFFQSFAGSTAKCFHQNGMAEGVARLNSSSLEEPDRNTLTIALSGTDSISSSGSFISCSVSGFKNWATQRISDLSVGLTTWGALSLPLDAASRVAFPNIFAFSATNATVALSAQVAGKSPVSMTLNFMVPYTGQRITAITLSGLLFSTPRQDMQPSAYCSLDTSAPISATDPVPLSLTSALAQLTMSFPNGGLPAGSGSYGVGDLSVTCKISNLVNAPSPSDATSSVSLAVFGNSLPIYFLSGIQFPALFGQSLGFRRPRITLSKYFVSDTGVVVTIALQPVVNIAAGSKLMVTVTGDLTAVQAPLVTSVSSPISAASSVSSQLVSSRELLFTFNADIAANSSLEFSVGSFRLPSASSPGGDAVEAALLDRNGNVVAPSSTGSYPATFTSPISGSSVSISSSVANALDVAVDVTLSPAAPKISSFRLTGLGFTAYAGSSGGRRLLQDGISCSNLIYSGAPSVRYYALDGELIVTFPGSNGATLSNSALPCVCTISGFRNPPAAVASNGVMVAVYDENRNGHGMQSGVIFPPVLCAPGYLQTVTGNSVSCGACPKGSYGNVPGASQCLLCQSGTYSSSTAATSPLACSSCPVGTFSNKTGATDVSVCTACLPGTQNSLLGASECKQCSPGTYAESSGLQACSDCRAGTYLTRSGATSRSLCSPCAAGTYSVAGSSLCTRCPPGKYSKEGDLECSKCAQGTYSTYGECLQCPGISHSLAEGSSSMSDCSGVRVVRGSSELAFVIGIAILIMYLLSFSFVPAWSAKDTVMRLELTADFEGRLKQKVKRSGRKHQTTWLERVTKKFSSSSDSEAVNTAAVEKRFFDVGDSVMWDGHALDGAIGTVESTSVYPEQDADEFGNFVVFVKIDPNCAALLKALSEAVQQNSGQKPVLIDSANHSCRCQLLDVPQSHARMPIFGIRLGRWELVRQISACFQLLLLSFFPAVDTITDLVYILSQNFFNYSLFAASVLCITSQFWVFVVRLKKRKVFLAFRKRTIELSYLKNLFWWPKWASPDSLPVFLTLILPLYIIYFVVFPVVWFFVGYIIYSFQLFPISRISNRWLYMFVYSLRAEKDSYRRRFDTCDAIILPMVQKGKVEETVLESVPQLVIQIVNGYLLGQSFQGFAIFSIALSVLSLSNTVWYYAYWNLFRCKPIRDVPSSLSLYNYKLSGVKEGVFSFAKPVLAVCTLNEDELTDIWRKEMTNVTVLDDSSTVAEDNDCNQIDTMPIMAQAAAGSRMISAETASGDQGTVSDKFRKAEEEMKAMDQAMQNLEAEKLRLAQELRQLSTLLHNSAATASGGASDHRSPMPDTVRLAICHGFLFLIFFEQVSLLQ
jgi:hypothetical protein